MCLPVVAVAQQAKDSTLHEVRVKARHNKSTDVRINDFASGQKVTEIDSTVLQQYRMQSLASLLTQQVPVFVKSYGFNGLATLNFRGSSAAQSQVLWNGVPIQNAALGIADVSTLPVMFMTKVNIVYGGSAALWGSGNVGGALLLENDVPVFDSNKRSLSLSGGAGSYGQYMGGLKGTISGRRWYMAANVFTQSAANNFAYSDLAGMRKNMDNGQLQSAAGMLQLAYKISAGNVISLSAWGQRYEREIPPALFESVSKKKQTDGSLRLLADWHKASGTNMWYAKSSFIKDDLQYRDEVYLLSTDNTVFQYFQEVGWRKQLKRHMQFLLFSPVQLAWLNTATGMKQQSKLALAGAYNLKRFDDRLDVSINLRNEVFNGRNIFLKGGSASYQLLNWFMLRANIQQSFRTPTLNELYYFPGGNTSLRPEQGWSRDIGYAVKHHTAQYSITHDLALYSRDINDWIIWLGGATWTPHNIAKVHSKGVETENKLTVPVGKWKLHLGVNTSYVIATTVESYMRSDGSIDKQIPYTPRYNGRLNIGFNYQRLTCNYNHTYTGYRFITSDESSYLLPYQTGNIQLMYGLSVKNHVLQLTGQCNNVWNEQYQVVAQRPMPGTNWQLGFKLDLL